MARGRMLNKSAAASLKIHNLPDDTCRVMALLTISHLDMNGVFYGSAVMVRSSVFPRRTDVSIEQVESFLRAMEEADLIVRFEANGELWQVWPGFQHNQPGLRRDRETFCYPLPPEEYRHDDDKSAGEFPPDDDEMPAECPANSRQIPARFPRDSRQMPAQGEVELELELEVNSAANAPPQTAKPPPKQRRRRAKSPPSAQTASRRALFAALAKATGWDPALKRGRLNKAVQRLERAGYTAPEVDKAALYWYRQDWRGKRKQRPNAEQLEEVIAEALKWKERDGPIDLEKYTTGEYADLFGPAEGG